MLDLSITLMTFPLLNNFTTEKKNLSQHCWLSATYKWIIFVTWFSLLAFLYCIKNCIESGSIKKLKTIVTVSFILFCDRSTYFSFLTSPHSLFCDYSILDLVHSAYFLPVLFATSPYCKCLRPVHFVTSRYCSFYEQSIIILF